MPLIIMVGYPASGKSTVVAALVAHVERTRPSTKIVLVEDRGMATFSRSIYRDSTKEKEHRGYVRSLTQQALTEQTLVIVDSLNYIKGYRYELYCVAKLAKTTYCVIYCDANPETVRLFNSRRENAADRYDDDILDALIQRFEAPDDSHRWDSPLFTIRPTSGEQDVLPADLSLDEIAACVFDGNRLRSNQSTQSQPLSSTNFLYELDSLTQSMVHSLIEAQKGAVPGDALPVAGTDQRVMMTKAKSLGELARLRRQFIAYTKMHPVDDRSKLAAMFVTFINNS